MKLKRYVYLIISVIGIISVNLIGCNNVEDKKTGIKKEEVVTESLDDIPPNIIDNIAPDANQKIKSEAKEFHVENMKGEEVYLSQFIGKPIVVNFWASY